MSEKLCGRRERQYDERGEFRFFCSCYPCNKPRWPPSDPARWPQPDPSRPTECQEPCCVEARRQRRIKELEAELERLRKQGEQR